MKRNASEVTTHQSENILVYNFIIEIAYADHSVFEKQQEMERRKAERQRYSVVVRARVDCGVRKELCGFDEVV